MRGFVWKVSTSPVFPRYAPSAPGPRQGFEWFRNESLHLTGFRNLEKSHTTTGEIDDHALTSAKVKTQPEDRPRRFWTAFCPNTIAKSEDRQRRFWTAFCPHTTAAQQAYLRRSRTTTPGYGGLVHRFQA